MQKLAIILHNGVEETEAITTIDIVRRAGIKIDLFSTSNNLTIISSHGIHFQAEKVFKDLKVETYDGIIFPGGPAVDELLEMDEIINLAREFFEKKKLVGAICAGPQILGKAGILNGKKVTHFPTSTQFMDQAIEQLDQEVVVQDNIITSAGAGTTVAFGLAIVEYLAGAEVKAEVKKRIVYHY